MLSRLSFISVFALGWLPACAADDVPIGTASQPPLEQACPAVATAPAEGCEQGKVAKLVKDDHGCEKWTCEAPASSCPAVAAPSSDACGPGKTAKLVKDDRGCDTWTCEASASSCPPIAAPPADGCGPGVVPVTVLDASGCKQWKCPTDSCSGVACDPGKRCQVCPMPGMSIAQCVPVGASC